MVDIGRGWRNVRKRRQAAEGVGVFGSPGFADDSQALADLLGRHTRLSQWMGAVGLNLEVSAAGLQVVDSMIDAWREDPTVASNLSNEVGVFLGSVMIHEINGAHWQVWPNGHPVIRLDSGHEIDVTAVASTRVRKGRPSLYDILDSARGSTGS